MSINRLTCTSPTILIASCTCHLNNEVILLLRLPASVQLEYLKLIIVKMTRILSSKIVNTSKSLKSNLVSTRRVSTNTQIYDEALSLYHKILNLLILAYYRTLGMSIFKSGLLCNDSWVI